MELELKRDAIVNIAHLTNGQGVLNGESYVLAKDEHGNYYGVTESCTLAHVRFGYIEKGETIRYKNGWMVAMTELVMWYQPMDDTLIRTSLPVGTKLFQISSGQTSEHYCYWVQFPGVNYSVKIKYLKNHNTAHF